MKIPLSYDFDLIKCIAAGRLHTDIENIEAVRIVKRAVNTKDKKDIHFVMTVDAGVFGNEDEVIFKSRDKNISKAFPMIYTLPKGKKLKNRPVVIGCGPAGMFAALILAEAGARPILLERGKDADSRRKSVQSFWKTGVLDTNSNVQFGEGGAGAFSDGKLKTGAMDARKIKILNEFVKAGAPEEIMYLAKPHIGTDRLHTAIKSIREKTISLGGEVHFNSTVTNFLQKDGKLTGIGFIKDGEYNEIDTDNVILAVGHSARDTFEKLLQNGVIMEQKPISVGVRIEHPQELINKIQYGDFYNHPSLGAADYRMVTHLKNKRNVYTFCMCPGGSVVAAASEQNCVVTNGMSEYKRDGKNANTALFVTVDKTDFASNHPLAGIYFQRKIEAAAFSAGGGGFKAPVQRLEDFLNNRATTAFGEVLPTYQPGTEFAPLSSYLPEYITESLKQGIMEMGEWMSGFYFPDALLTGAETRSSSPVRILRNENLEAVGIKGLYPCGEGAGYAGGIVSAAADGIRCAEQILNAY